VRRVSFCGATPEDVEPDHLASMNGSRMCTPAAGCGSSAANGSSQLAGRGATAAILYPDVAAFAAAGIASGADCYAQLPSDQQQQQYKARSEWGGSMVTDATWLTDAGQSAAASMVSPTLTGLSSRGWDSSIDSCAWGSKFETVFHMTGARQQGCAGLPAAG
jgi:hypothetical protein